MQNILHTIEINNNVLERNVIEKTYSNYYKNIQKKIQILDTKTKQLMDDLLAHVPSDKIKELNKEQELLY